MRAGMLIALVIPFACAAIAQVPASVPASDSAEIYASAPNTMPEMRAHFAHSRYELHNATLIELVRTAWSVSADSIVGGPDWLDTNRFDVIASAPEGSTSDALHRLLQQILIARFHLAVHSGTRNTPAFTITSGAKLQLQNANPDAPAGCQVMPNAGSAAPRGAPPPPVSLICHNITMAAFAKALSGLREASGYIFNYPVVDRTGVDGAWDFTLRWSPRNIYFRSAPPAEVVTLPQAFERIGLKLEMAQVATPALVIDRIEEPRVLPAPRPQPEFEVAELKPNQPDVPCSNVRVDPGGRVRIDMTLFGLIQEAWGALRPNHIFGATESMNAPCWNVLAKAPVEDNAPAGWDGPVWNGLDIDSMRLMLRSLLRDRFGLAAHEENRAIDGYALVARKPKLRTADPSNRPGCREGPGPDGKDPRLVNPAASRLITCRNMTLARYASELHDLLPGDIPVVDATRIAGRYDLTLNFSPPAVFQSASQTNAHPDGDASLPDGAISPSDALRTQLGLKLEPRKIVAPVLVIDHVNLRPSEN